jgi:RimJ/RimL family protein N-acetyltransferase
VNLKRAPLKCRSETLAIASYGHWSRHLTRAITADRRLWLSGQAELTDTESVSEWAAFGSLRTARMRLDPLTLDHIDLLVGLDSDPEVMRYINGGKPSSRREVEATVRAHLGYRWAAFTDRESDFVGWFSMRPAGDRTYDLGYRLRRQYWDQGLAVEGSMLLIDLAFKRLGPDRVRADTMAVNERSRRVMEKCGLRYVRTFHLEWDEPIAGTDAGDVEYEIRRDDYLPC